MRTWLAGVSAIGALACGCSTSSHHAAPPASDDAGCDGDACEAPDAPDAAVACAPGFQALPDGIGCDPIIPAQDCPAGTMATLGSTTCAPVGSTSCPSGFHADPSGWGCSDIIPPAACTGATMEVLGQTTCQPVGNCSATFPPATATLFVSPTVTPDATHFQTIGAAIAAAPSGAVIAVDAGTYVESLVVTKPLSLVGRCAAQVTVSNPPTDAPGLDVNGAGIAVTVTGFTFTGARPGIVAEQGCNLTFTADVVDSNRDVGFLAQNPGTIATITGSVVRDTQDPNGVGWGVYSSLGSAVTVTSSAVVGNKELGVTLTDNGSTAKLSSVVVSGTQVGTSGVANGIGVQQGTSLTMVSSVVAGSAGVGLAVSGAQASVTTSVIRDTASASNGTSGDGISAITGSTVNVDSSWLFRNREVAVSISGVGTTATISKSTVYDSQPNGMGQFGVGISLESGAKLAMTGSVVAKSLYYGIELSDANTSAQIDDCLFRDTALDQKDGVGRNIDVQDGAKAVLQGTTVANASGESVVVDSTMSHADINATQMLILGGHIGAFVRLGGTLEMAESALVGNIGQGLYLTADEGASGVHSTATMTDSVIRDTQTGASSSGGDTSGEGVLSGGIVSLTNVTVNNVYGSGVLIANNPQPVTMGSTGTITGGVVRGVKPEPMGVTLGHGIIGLDGSLVTVTGCTVTGSPGAGVAFESATALVAGAFITNNAVGIDVEGTSMVSQVDVAPAMLTTGQVVVTSSTVFTGNQSTISSMNLPLPPVPLMP